jgi:hypothetical protein
MSNDPVPQTASSNGAGTNVSMRFPVLDKDTVGSLVPGMLRNFRREKLAKFAIRAKA